jgi:putative ABC transport system permease protein
MTWLSELGRRLLVLLRRRQFDRDLEEEMRLHRELREQDHVEAGASPEEAHYAALRRFGNVALTKERSREMWGWSWLENTTQDVRYGLRQLRRSPGFTAMAVFTLALGIGANTAIFSVVNAALLRPLPYKDPGRLVYVWSAEKARGINQSTVSIPDLHDWREQNRVFDGIAGWWSGTYNLSGGDEPQQVAGWTVSPSFFDVLGARPKLGRTFDKDEEQGSRGRVVVLSHSLWIGSFGGDRRILGRTIALDGEPHNVIGVMPAEFSSPFPDVQVWVPWPVRAESIAHRGDRFMRVIGRLKPSVTVRQAQGDMDTIARHLAQTYQEDAGVTAYVVPAAKQITGSVRPALLVLLGTVGFVLLIGCANLANLLLTRSAARQREFAVRAALGAGRLQLVRQLLTESALLSNLGGAVGILLAAFGVRYLRLTLATQIPRAQEINLDGHVLLFTLGLSVLTGLAFGLFPALRSFNNELNESLKAGGRGWGAGVPGRRVRDLLVIWEMALALMLLAGAGLLVSSFERLRAIDPGFNPDKVLTCEISLPSKYKDPEIATFFRQLLDRVRALPGVKAAGATMTLPLRQRGGGFWGGLNIEGRPAATRESIPIVSFVQVTPGYFRAMGIPVLKGREFNEADNNDQSPKAAIINGTLARRFFSDSDPLGRRICMGEDCSKGPWLTVVGVVGDAALESLTDPRFPQVFSPHAQGVEGGVAGNMELVLRASSDPLSLAGTVSKAVHELDKNQSVADIQKLNQVVGASLAQPRFNTLLLAAFAALALLLAAIGIYGVTSYSVALRTREIGIRTALGAARADVLTLVLGHGMSLALAGGAIGLVGALILAHLISSLLYGVKPGDPPTFLAAFAVLVGVALFATYIPARRATKVDPMVALRYE